MEHNRRLKIEGYESNQGQQTITDILEKTADYRRGWFHTISRGSAFETQNHLLYENGVGYFVDEITQELFDEDNELIHQLNKIMK